MKDNARAARSTGIGNCYEKACLAAEYIYEHFPAGRNLAVCQVDENYKGFTGNLVSKLKRDSKAGGGDHVFCVHDIQQQGNSVSSWGDDAVIVDGWMNDCYPAKHFLAWKYKFKSVLSKTGMSWQ